MLEQLKLMKHWFTAKLASQEQGVTIVEYAIMLVLVAVAVIIAGPNITDGITQLFSGVSAYLSAPTITT